MTHEATWHVPADQEKRLEATTALNGIYTALRGLVMGRLDKTKWPANARPEDLIVESVSGAIKEGRGSIVKQFHVSNYNDYRQAFHMGGQKADLMIHTSERNGGVESNSASRAIEATFMYGTLDGSGYTAARPAGIRVQDPEFTLRAAQIVQEVIEDARPEDIRIRAMVPYLL